jgi:hypothetical protein
LVFPGMQLFPWQQPMGQDWGVQVHRPLTQPWLVAQARQGAPFLPQAVAELPGTQLPWLSQQPAGQVELSHWICVTWQTWLWQASFCLQVLQGAPPEPQAFSVVPETHCPAELQQPLLQVAGPQAVALHCLFTHCSPLLQVLQGAPPEPQAAGLLPGMQLSLKQQPLWQVAGPQGALMQRPTWQI